MAPTATATVEGDGDGAPTAGAARRGEFAELSRRVRDRGLLARRGGYYAVKIPIVVAGLAAVVATVIVVGDSWWSLLAAVGLAFVLAQIGFLGHDAGHRQIWARRRANDTVGLMLTNLLSGFSFGWWLAKHSRHHAHTNSEDRDPDIAAGALVFTPGQARACGRFGRWFAGIQTLMLVPLLFLEALNLHVASVRALSHRRDRAALVESGLLVLHAGIFFVSPFLVLSPLRAVAFIVVSQALFGFYLGASFLPNHVGMPTSDRDDRLGFLRRQVQSSRNLAGSAMVGFLFGGLDSQIEHHLFPTMPRANLRRARAVVRAYCVEEQIPYAEQSLRHAYRDVVLHLRAVGGAGVGTVG
jgi:fatty acid desaturase